MRVVENEQSLAWMSAAALWCIEVLNMQTKLTITRDILP